MTRIDAVAPPSATHQSPFRLHAIRFLVAVASAFLLGLVSVAAAQQPPNSPRAKAAMRLQQYIMGTEDTADYLAEHFAPSLATGEARARTIAKLEELRNKLRDGQLAEMMPEGPMRVLTLWETPSGPDFEITLQLTDSKPHKIKAFEAKPVEANGRTNPVELTWDTLQEWFEAEAENGFSGAAILVRDGKVVLHEGYGWANPEKRIPNKPETIFAIGSTPIDFTMAAILQLYERGELDLSDAITRHFDDVPDDKRSITLEHLMTGRSGLQDFHDLPGDENPDHTWIDRAEAMRRIFSMKLRFEPGKGRAHSHSAFGVLAAVVEIVSGQSYEDYTRENLFKPAGMTSTGFFGEAIPEERLAVGTGMNSSGEINAPPYWGRTSWLVLGSGGQVSTVSDMARWLNALHAGKIIDRQHVRRIVGPGGRAMGIGGNQFGFEILYTMAPNNFFIIISNAIDSQKQLKAMRNRADALRELYPPVGNPYSVGIAIDADETGVRVMEVMPGSAAQRDGLAAGDRVLTIASKSMRDHDPIEVLDELLQTGKPIDFEIERNGKKKSVRVTPKKR